MWNKKISDMLDAIQDDTVSLSEAGACSAAQVQAITLAKVRGEAAARRPRRRPVWGKLLAVAAAAAVLTTTGLAVGVSQGWVHFFPSEEEVVQAAMAGAEGDTAGHSVPSRNDYEELQSVGELADLRLESTLSEGETLVEQAQGTPSDGWTRMRTTEYEEDGRLLWDSHYQADGLAALTSLWDTGLELTWLEEHYTPNPGAGLATFHREAGEELAATFYAELIGEYSGEDGQIFNLQYVYEKGSEPLDQYRLAEEYYEYYTTKDGVQAAIQMETSHTGKSLFWVDVSMWKINFSMFGTQVELNEIHAILDSLELSQMTGSFTGN